MNECLEVIIRIFFLLLKFMWNHAILTLIIILIGIGLGKIKNLIILGIVGYVMNIFQDHVTFATWVFGLGLAASALVGILFGIIWMIIVLNCKANNAIKIIASPLFFILGLIWFIFPTPGIGLVLPLTPFLGLLLNMRYINHIILAIPFVMGLGLILNLTPIMIVITPFLCDKLNFVLALFA